jgi:hypothetical protein
MHVQDNAKGPELNGNVHVQGNVECIEFEENITTSYNFCIKGEMEGEVSGIVQLQASKLPSNWII